MRFKITLHYNIPRGGHVVVPLSLDNAKLRGAALEDLTTHLENLKGTHDIKITYVVADTLRAPLLDGGEDAARAMGDSYLEKNKKYLRGGTILRWEDWITANDLCYKSALAALINNCIKLPTDDARKTAMVSEYMTYGSRFLIEGDNTNSLSTKGKELLEACRTTAVDKKLFDDNEIKKSVIYQISEYIFYIALPKTYGNCYHLYPAPMWSGLITIHCIFPDEELPVYVPCDVTLLTKTARHDGKGLYYNGVAHTPPNGLDLTSRMWVQSFQGLTLQLGEIVNSDCVSAQNKAQLLHMVDKLFQQAGIQVKIMQKGARTISSTHLTSDGQGRAISQQQTREHILQSPSNRFDDPLKTPPCLETNKDAQTVSAPVH